MTEDFDREHRKLWASTALLALGLSSLWHVAWMPAWELLVVGLLAAWRVTALWRSWRLPPRWVTWAVSLAIFAGLILELGDELVGPQAASLIVAMIWVKTLELRDRRDATVVCLVACFLPVSAAVLAFSLLASLWAALALLVAMAALWRCRVGGGTWRRASLGASGLLARAAIPALILLLILPRPDVRGMLEELGMNRQETGLSDRLEPGSVAQLAQSEDLAFRASFNGEPPEGPWYWRAMVLWESRGLSWRIGACGHPGGLEDIGRLDSEVSYQVTLEPHGLPWLVALDRPALPISEEGSRLMCGHVLRRDWPVNQRLQYEARSDLAESPRLMSPVHIDASRRLPDSLSVRARSLAAQLRGDQPQETARNILRWFAENGFAYTLDPGTMGGNELDQFLFQRRRGFCEHYAAATATLMRAAGHSSRVVVGFTGGQWNPVGGHVTVRRKAAHAWVEILAENDRWIRVDPAGALFNDVVGQAAVNPDDAEDAGSELAGATTEGGGDWGGWGSMAWLDALDARWNQFVLGYDQAARQRLLARLGLEEEGPLAWLVFGVALVAAFVVGALGVVSWRWWRQRPPATVRWWHRFCRTLAGEGVVREAGEAPLAYARRASEAKPEAKAAIERFVEIWLPARYGPESLDRKRERQLREALNELR